MNKNLRRLLLAACALCAGLHLPAAQAGSDPFVGQMIWVPYNFAPSGWAFCNGQLLSISSNSALFSLLGTQYGGDGVTTFALPNMQGRQLINAGQGVGLSDYPQGQSGGEETVTLTDSQLPAHSHAFVASTATATETTPAGNLYAQPANAQLYGETATTTLAANALANTGGGQPHNNMMPGVTLNCIIALQGIYPPRP